MDILPSCATAGCGQKCCRLPVVIKHVYVVCPKSKCTDFLFKCQLDSPEITSYLLQSMTLGKLHCGSVFFADHSCTGSHKRKCV